MSVALSPEQMMKLMAYADGELEGADRDEVEALLAEDAGARSMVTQIAGLGSVVSAIHEDRAGNAIASFDVADAVMAKIADAPPPKAIEDTPRSVVSPLEEARARRAARMKVGGGVVAALALAAAVFLVARQKETPMAAAPVAVASPKASSENAGPSVEVDAVEGAGNSVSVYYFPSSNELSTNVVVWVDETGEK